MTLFDWVVITFVGLSALLALFRGFIREVLSLAAWLIAAFVTFNYYESVQAWLATHIPSKVLVLGASTAGLFMLVLLVVAIVNAMIMRFLQAGGDISILDSVLGMCFGVARGLFILSLAFIMFAVIVPRDDFPDMVKNARTLPVVEYSAGLLSRAVPQVKEFSEAAREKGEDALRQEAEEELRRMQDSPQYDREKRMDLEQLLDRLDNRRSTEPEDKAENRESR